ncbi:MAG: KilA-N domain-containing protein [Bacteroidales bacterium]|jgi:hypothetical protein|nr:KilA-N domain-containing protein [Bacteroidales bacterium]
MKELTLFDKQNETISKIHHEGDMVSLTDLWKAAGSPSNKRPIDWQEKESTREFIDTLEDMFKSAKIALLKTKRGKTGGGTYGVKQIALAYAKWLDPKLHVLVNEVFFQRVAEEKNPDLIAERYIHTYKRKGKTDKWITERFEGRAARNMFTATLAEHKVVGEGFRDCTNAIYEPLFGGTTAAIREKYGIEKRKNIRDNLNMVQLAAIKFSETLASDDIEKNNRKGNVQCETASRRASVVVGQALMSYTR